MRWLAACSVACLPLFQSSRQFDMLPEVNIETSRFRIAGSEKDWTNLRVSNQVSVTDAQSGLSDAPLRRTWSAENAIASRARLAVPAKRDLCVTG